MPLPIPKLDDRTFDDLLQDAKRRIPALCPEWTDFNDSDPGMTLIHLMAHMADTLLYRLNRVPERNFVKFLELMGVDLRPPRPAKAWVVFDVAGGAKETDLNAVPAGTRVSTRPQEGQAIGFETLDPLTLTAASFTQVFSKSGETFSSHTGDLLGETPKPVEIFCGETSVPHMLYLGDTHFGPLPGKARLELMFDVVEELDGGFPLEWEQRDGDRWVPVAPAKDETKGLGRGGKIFFDSLPSVQNDVGGSTACWLRVRLIGTSHFPLDRRLPHLGAMKRRVVLDKENGVLPETAYIKTAAGLQQPIDVSMAFYPFGDKPKLLDKKREIYAPFGIEERNCFYVGSPLLGELDGVIAMEIEVTEGYDIRRDALLDVEIHWEYYSESGIWKRLGASHGFEDDTNALTQSGTILFNRPEDAVPFTMAGEARFCVRARLVTGTYGRGKHCNPPMLISLRISLEENFRNWEYYQVESYLSLKPLDAPTPENPVSPFLLDDPEEKGPMLYMALDKRPANLTQRFYFQIGEQRGRGSVPAGKVSWQYRSREGWKDLRVLKDDTEAFTKKGAVEFIAPADWDKNAESKISGYWLRSKLQIADFRQCPVLEGLYTNAVEVVQAETRRDAVLGSGSNEPLQTFHFPESPVLPGPGILVREHEDPAPEVIERWGRRFGEDLVKEPAGVLDRDVKALWLRWQEVENLFGSGPADRHYVLDPVAGTIRFGDGRHGRIPPAGRDNIKAENYRVGGGARGNVGTGAICVLDSTFPSVDGVRNIEPARGGADQETVEEAKARGPFTVKHRYRAVTHEDFEQLAKEASAEVALARCLPKLSRHNEVQVIIVPKGDAKPVPSNRLIRIVTDYLDERRVINTRVRVRPPGYADCAIEIDVVLEQSALGMFPQIRLDIEDRIRNFVHPIKGGSDGKGWPMGRTVHLSEMYYLLEAVSGVNYVDRVRLSRAGVDERKEKLKIPDTAFPYFKDIAIRQV